MIRLGKPVQLLEWGEGTNTMNQVWEQIGSGVLRLKPKTKEGVTLLQIEVDGQFKRKNIREDAVKVMQQGEGMTPASKQWGEVAFGKLKSIEPQGSKTIVSVELKGAIKVGK